MTELDSQLQTRLEAAAFRRLIAHLSERTDVQNIDLMILAGFCRNCLSKWYAAAASEEGLEMDLEDAREIVYGMPYADWKDRHQQPVPDEKLRAFKATQK